MPVSAYLKAGLFVVAAAAALFAAAGTVAIPGFWAYLAIFAVVMIVSFAALDPDLLRERMRPGGKKPPLALRVFSLVLFMHWIAAGRGRHAIHLDPSGDRPPPGTTMWTCGWWVSAEPHVWSTEMKPMRAPRCLGSAAIVSVVSAEALNSRS